MSPAPRSPDRPRRRARRLCRSVCRGAVALALLALAAVAAPAASAQVSGFYPEHFQPLPTPGVNLLNLAGSEVLGHLVPSLGLMLQYVDDPLQLVTDGANEAILQRLVSHQLRTDLWLAMGFAGVVDLGVVMPLVLHQAGQDLAVFGRPGEQVRTFAVGDLRLIPKLRLLNAEDHGGLGLAALLDVALPTGSREDFASDGGLRIEPRLVLDWTDADSGFGVVANVGYHLRPRTPVHNLVVDDAVTWGIGVRVPTPAASLRVIGSVFGAVPLSDNVDPSSGEARSDGRSTAVELAVAAELLLGDLVGTAGGGFGLTQGYGSPDFRLFLTVGYLPRCVDNDDDGVCNPVDGPGGACKDAPEDEDGFEDHDGCPDPDNDQDGVPDVADGAPDARGFGVCRDRPEDVDGFEDHDGCPDPDNDQDGVPDRVDGAPDPAFPGFGACRGVDADASDGFSRVREDRDGYQDDDGCPDPDNDGDGVPDVRDGDPDAAAPGFGRCRGVDVHAPGFGAAREDVDGFMDEDGCPDPDNDGDGVLDVDDGPPRDPNYPGFGVCRDGAGPTAQALAERGLAPPWRYLDPETVWPGCQAIPTPRCECGKLEIPFKITFKYGKWGLTPESELLLDQVAAILADKACIARIRVEGHTDWHGPDGANDALSGKRAAAVADYLIGRGLAADRFEAVGYGERLPLDPNDAYRDRVCRRCSPGCTCEVGSAREPNPNEAQIRGENRRSVFRVVELEDPDGSVRQCKMPYGAPAAGR